MPSKQHGVRRQSGVDPVALLLHYANEAATERTWRGIVLGPGAAFDGYPTNATPFGVQSLEAFLVIQVELRSVLERVVALDSAYAEEARSLAREITNRARLKFGGWTFSPLSERLFELWDTENTSFEEFLYFTVAQALRNISFRDLHRCETCRKFFVDASKRERKFCSNTCRSRMTVRKHRENTVARPSRTKGRRGQSPQTSTTPKGSSTQ